MIRRHSNLSFILAWLGGSLLTAALLISFRASADGSALTDDLPRLLPYEGHLAKDGNDFTGRLDMTFSVYDSASGGTALWSETQTVSIYKGAFGVLLGSKAGTTALSAAVESASALWVGVKLTTSTGDVTLNNRKRIVPVPYAMITTAATGASVGGQFALESNVSMSADGTTGPLTITDSESKRITFDGNDIDSSDEITFNASSQEDTYIGGDITMAGDTLWMGSDTLIHQSDDSLRVDALPDGTSVSYVTRTMVYGTTTINGNVTGLSVSFTMDNDGGSGDCTDYDLQANDGANNYHYFCPDGRVLVGGRWQGIVGNNAKGLQIARCCRPNITSVK